MRDSTPSPSRIDSTVIERASRVIRILGHPLRLRILEILEAGERNVTDLQDELAVTQAVISQQLAVLRSEAVVAPRRDGARVYYRIIEPKVSRILDCIRECDLPERADLMVLPGFVTLVAGPSNGPEEADTPTGPRPAGA